ncbi:ATP-grasp fold amidoligase family protein [Sphingomonas sp. Tas61C01]|uniref:ATP-grasp fold amidoligase family protein n=1 Tax=Sphingomonas sp. Tas61C01 TaxID=3458297 RepID=UPI00403EC697
MMPAPGALLRIHLAYRWRHGRWPDLRDPHLFTELVQLRKLYDRDVRMPIMADKIAIKAIVADRLGTDWVVPTLWSGMDLPHEPALQGPVVVKSRHGCNQNIFVPDAAPDWRSIRDVAAAWLRRPYGRWLDEWLYTQIPRGLLIEPFVGEGGTLPVDYKFYVFDGEVTHVQVHLDRGAHHRWIVHDIDFRPVSGGAAVVPKPSALPAMIDAAREMARGFGFARVDFYQPAERPLFGEICFYPGSGLDRFDPPELDATMGRSWLRAGAIGAPDRTAPLNGHLELEA